MCFSSIPFKKSKAKLAGLMHKPQQQQFGGAVKKGLGGISNEELFEKKSFKKEHFTQPKQFKNITTMFLNLADVQQRIGIYPK